MIKASINGSTVKVNMTGTNMEIIPDTVVLCAEIIRNAMKTFPPHIKRGDDYILSHITKLVKDE